MTDKAITASDIIKFCNGLGLPKHEPKNPFGLSAYAGLKIVTHEPRYKPKIQLSDSFEWCSDEFRKEINARLLRRFGSKDISLIKPNEVLMFGSTVVMRPEAAVMLSDV